MMKTSRLPLIRTAVCALLLNAASAEVKLPSFFADGMVLQQQTGAAIWGWAEPGTQAAVAFAGQVKTTQADAEGRWTVVLDGLAASKEGRDLNIQVGGDRKTIQDVVVGEVWLASGQSNMVWPMYKGSTKKYAATVNKPLIRHYRGEFVAAYEAQDDFVGEWLPATPENTLQFGGVAFHFSEKLYEELDVPIGILQLAWGGQKIQSFISQEALRASPQTEKDMQKQDERVRRYDPERAESEYQLKLAEYAAKLARWEENDQQGGRPRKPNKKNPITDPGGAAQIHKGMIHPFIGYGMRGAIWYQGENNRNDASRYAMFLEMLVKDWRAAWATDFPFYWVQLASIVEKEPGPGFENQWVDVQEQQRLALAKIGNAGMVVANDIGGGLHPGNKQDVGLRLARWALNRNYGQAEVVVSGPLFKSVDFKGSQARVEFDYNDGLRTRDGGELTGFDLLDTDGNWAWAKAEIVDDAVHVRSPSGADIVRLRYAWHKKPDNANLVNAAGLPASCFSVEAD